MINNLKEKAVRALRWSEQYTKTDMVYLAKGGWWLTIGEIITIIAGVLLSIAFANLLPKETYGTYKFVISIAGIVSAFTLSGMGHAVTRATAKGYEGSLRKGFKSMLVWSLGIVIIGLGLSGYYFFQQNNLLGISMILIAFSYPLIQSSRLYINFLTGIKNFKYKSFYLIIWEITQLAVVGATLFLTDDLLIILSIFFAINTVLSFSLYLFTLKKFKPNRRTTSETISYGKHLSIINIINTVAKHIDKVLIFHFLGAVELAVYSFAVLPIQKLDNIKGIIGNLALPKFSKTSISTLKKTLTKKAFILFGLSVFSTVILIAVLPNIFKLIFPQYMESVIYAQVFSVSILAFPGILFAQALRGHAKKKELYKSDITANVLKIIGLLILLPMYGIWGAIFILTGEVIIRALLYAGLFYWS
jgi:O-antigen/teichoic acid export membrane protein